MSKKNNPRKGGIFLPYKFRYRLCGAFCYAKGFFALFAANRAVYFRQMINYFNSLMGAGSHTQPATYAGVVAILSRYRAFIFRRASDFNLIFITY